MLAVLLPIRHSPASTIRVSLPIYPASALRHSLGLSLHTAPSVDWTLWALGAWLVGAVLFALYLAGLQRAFVNGLGTLSGSRRVLRAGCPEGCPVLLGVLRPKVILPTDFESRYTRLERLLVFSHERTPRRQCEIVCRAFVHLSGNGPARAPSVVVDPDSSNVMADFGHGALRIRRCPGPPWLDTEGQLQARSVRAIMRRWHRTLLENLRGMLDLPRCMIRRPRPHFHKRVSIAPSAAAWWWCSRLSSQRPLPRAG